MVPLPTPQTIGLLAPGQEQKIGLAEQEKTSRISLETLFLG